jgi:hypothetical protein
MSGAAGRIAWTIGTCAALWAMQSDDERLEWTGVPAFIALIAWMLVHAFRARNDARQRVR